MHQFVRVVLRWRVAVLLLWLAITAASAGLLSQAVISSSLGRLFFGDAPSYRAYLETMAAYASDDVIVIGVEGVDPLADDTLDRLERATGAMMDAGAKAPADPAPAAATDGFGADGDGFGPADDFADKRGEIRRVTSVLSAERVRLTVEGDERRLDVRPYAELARAHPAERDALRQALRDDPLYGGLLIAEDAAHLAVVVELEVDADRAGETLPGLCAQLTDALVDAGFARSQLHLAGMPVTMAEMMRQTEHNLRRVLPITAVVLLLTVFVLFRRLWPAAIAGVVAVSGVLWTMGLAVLLDPRISIMHSIAPMVILIVASSDVIHLCSAYLIELQGGKPKAEAIQAASADVGTACLYTSLTTFIGFMALSFVPTPVFRSLGIILGAGVAFALLIAVTIVPVFFSYMRAPAAWRVGSTSAVQGALDRALAAAANASTRRPWWVIAGWALVLAGAGYGLAQLEIETALSRRMAADNPVSMDRDWFDAHFAAANQLDLLVETPTPGGVHEPAFVAKLVELERRLEARPGVDAVFALTDVWRRIHAAMAPESATPLPTTRGGFAEYTLLFEFGGEDTLSRLTDFERRTALVSLRLQDEGVRAAYDLGQSATAEATALFGQAATVRPTGMMYLVGEWIGEILAGQRRGVLFSFALVALMMIIGLRSIWTGLWSMVPNLLPLMALGGWVGITQDQTDSDTLILAMLAIGIGVDDTIHFLMRLRIEARRTTDRATALARTFDFAGRGIVMTTVVLTLGFLPFATTDYYSTSILGTLLPMTLIVALLADVLLVPAMGMVGLLRFAGPSETDV